MAGPSALKPRLPIPRGIGKYGPETWQTYMTHGARGMMAPLPPPSMSGGCGDACGCHGTVSRRCTMGFGWLPTWGAGYMGILASLAISVGSGYLVGRALAPSTAKKNKWGWIGGGLGLLPFGLPGLAIYKLSRD